MKMNLAHKRHRGVIGIESAIVLIAFVIVAAALAFVVLNMGFATTQEAKTTITSGLNEAGTSLTIAGKVAAFVNLNGNPNVVNATTVPLKVSSGGSAVDLDDTRTAVKYFSNSVEYNDVLVTGCTISGEYASTTLAFDQAVLDGCISVNPIGAVGGDPAATRAVIYWSEENISNSILEPGEHANLAVAFRELGTSERPGALDDIRMEIVLASGATLTIERQIPTSLSSEVVDMG
jgi:archaeal flagellin FlaB